MCSEVSYEVEANVYIYNNIWAMIQSSINVSLWKCSNATRTCATSGTNIQFRLVQDYNFKPEKAAIFKNRENCEIGTKYVYTVYTQRKDNNNNPVKHCGLGLIASACVSEE